MNQQLLRNIESMYFVCDQMDKLPLNIPKKPDQKFRDLLKNEFMGFIGNLTVCSHLSVPVAVDFIRTYIDQNTNEFMFMQYRQRSGCTRENYLDSVPPVLQAAVKVDAALFRGESAEADSIGRTLYIVYGMICVELLQKQPMALTELCDYMQLFLSKIRNYLGSELPYLTVKEWKLRELIQAMQPVMQDVTPPPAPVAPPPAPVAPPLPAPAAPSHSNPFPYPENRQRKPHTAPQSPPPPAPMPTSPVQTSSGQQVPISTSGTALRMGERMELTSFVGQTLEFRLSFDSLPTGMEVDCYAFLLNEEGRVMGDSDLVFFSNPVGANGSVSTQSTAKYPFVMLKLNQVPEQYAKIAVCYSAYGDKGWQNFQQMKNPVLQVITDGHELFHLTLDHLTLERTVVGAEVYRHRGKWKLNAVGMGYHGMLRTLCESYGVEIE